MNWLFILFRVPIWDWITIELYIDRNRRIYAISTVTQTGRPGNNGRLLTTRNCVLTRVWRPKTFCIWGMCVYAQRHEVYAKNCTLHCKKLTLWKKRVVVLIRKIILPLISLFSKLVNYTLITVTIYVYFFRRTFSSTQSIDIVLFFQYNLPCCNVSTYWKGVSR